MYPPLVEASPTKDVDGEPSEKIYRRCKDCQLWTVLPIPLSGMSCQHGNRSWLTDLDSTVRRVDRVSRKPAAADFFWGFAMSDVLVQKEMILVRCMEWKEKSVQS
jgi:hypothetical protein